MSKRFLVILAVIFAVFVGYVMFSKHDKGNNSNNGSGSSHVIGNGKVTLTEFGDYQCPACGAYYPIFKDIESKYGKDITFQFRNFPLVNIHKNAMVAARAAEAASNQNKFWEMHDMLYERQQQWSSSSNASRIFEDYATELGLNIDTFKTDMNSSVVNDTINADVKAAQNLKATGTPTVVLNGVMLDPLPTNPAQLSQMVADAIKQQK